MAARRSIAFGPWARARSRTSTDTFGRPPGLPLCPGCQADFGARRFPVCFCLFSDIRDHGHVRLTLSEFQPKIVVVPRLQRCGQLAAFFTLLHAHPLV